MIKPRTLLALLAATVLTCSFLACDDDPSDDDDDDGTGASGAGASGAGSASCAEAGTDCATLCDVFWCCSEPACGDFEATDKADFVASCVVTCESPDGAALKAIINGDDCATTVGTIKVANPLFACSCDAAEATGNGIDCTQFAGGSGGTGGAGGA